MPEAGFPRLRRMDIKVRQARSSDFGGVSEVFEEANQFHVELLPDRFRILKPIMTHEWFEEIIASSDKSLIVAEHKNEIAGAALVKIKTNPDFPIFKPRRYGYVEEIAVLGRYRGKGIGKLLMGKVHAWVLDRKSTEIELHVWEANQAAIGFYEKLGYTTSNRMMKITLSNANRHKK
jgi:ribosomal protein S18 acetylase RimI-like enzyme